MSPAVVQRIQRTVTGYLVALLALSVAAAVGLSVTHFFSYTGVWRTFATVAFYVAIMASAWWGGYGPGIAATFITLLGAPYLVMAHPRKPEFGQLLLILLVSLLISRVAQVRRKVETMLRTANEELDERVRQRTAELERANAALRQHEALLLRQADELSRSNADLQQFAYVASHDLQEPLRMIATYTQLLAQRFPGHLDSEAKEYVGVVIDGVHRMEKLIRDLLAYSRVIHADTAELEGCDTNAALDIAVSNLEPAILESGASIERDVLPLLPCDRSQLVQLFQNLLSNALKYRSEAAPKITISSEERASEWVFAVQDNGIGIAPEYHGTIFEPFRRLHGREYPGNGVGLAICRRIVERHGGRIWVESEPGQGSTFKFGLPGTRVQAGASLTTPSHSLFGQ